MQICKFASLESSFHFIPRRLGTNYRYVIPLVDNPLDTALIKLHGFATFIASAQPFAGGRIEEFLMFQREAACLGVSDAVALALALTYIMRITKVILEERRKMDFT